MATVTGLIRNETGGPAIGALVRVFDKDMRHEELLGEIAVTESGNYRIVYLPTQFHRSEKKTADLIVRAFDREGNLRAESEIRFNARDEERIDLTFGPVVAPERSRLSELEQLIESIEPVRERVEYHAFTDADLTFLTEETIRAGSTSATERRIVRDHLGFLRLASQFALRTNIPLAAFYGWFRQDQPQVLEELMDVAPRTLRTALVNAIRDRVIPDLTAELSEILELVDSWNLDERRVVNHRFVVQLVNAQTNEPLSGYFVAVSDPAAFAGEQDLDNVVTDEHGACEIGFSLRGSDPANTTRRLRLVISDQGEAVAETTIDARANQEEVAVVRVQLREPAGSVPIEDVASPALATRLRQQGIRTLTDLLAHPEVEDGEELVRLRGAAKFSVLTPELTNSGREHLLSRGFQSLLDVGTASRAQFVRTDREALDGDANTFATLFAAKETGKVLYHMIGSAWFKKVTSPDDEPDDPDIPTGVDDVLNELEKCGCKDCESAVSPTAYLAHLLEWTLQHIKDGDDSIAFTQLAEEFHQPFGELPASCAAVEEQVHQVRIAVEVLWRFTDFLESEDLQLPTSFRTAYRHLRNQLYRLILNKLGTSFEQLRSATLQISGDDLVATRVAKERQALADLLGIDQSHLNELFFNIEQPPVSPSESDLERLFGFKSTRAGDVFAAPPTPELIAWQRERLDEIWQTQDWTSDAYAGANRLPFVDPVLIDESYLRTPLPANPAFALLSARREALAEHRVSLADQNPQENGLVQLLESELGQSIDQLRELYATLQAVDQAAAQAHETIASLGLTTGGFSHLMSVDERLENGEPIAATDEEIAAAWEAVFDVLSRAHRLSLFPAWVDQENDADLLFGPVVFWSPVTPAAPVNAWQAAPDERRRWEEALARRSELPIIDPDQIQAKDITVIKFNSKGGLSVFNPPSLSASSLWHQRRVWVDDRLEALRDARQGQGSTSATFAALLNASTVGIDAELFEELANLEANGASAESRLAQLNLTIAEFRLLARIHQRTVANASVASAMWQEADAILVQAEKRREYAAWRAAEQASGITLHPSRFEIPAEVVPDDSPQTRWLHNPLSLRQWTAKLAARVAQRQALDQGLARAVDSAAEIVLPLLRNILVMQTSAPAGSLQEKADWLDRRLLVDMQMDGCQKTSRISQAIETLQRFIRGVYTQEHLSLMQHLTLDAEEDYQLEWPVIGSYATWRAYMLAYLYPENLLHVTPPARQSFGFTRLKKELPSRVEPAHACAAAQEYAEYFQDVFHLEVQASCQVRTRVDRKTGCGPTTAALRSLVHVFALATNSGRVYTNSFDSYYDTKDTLDQWEPVPKLANVVEIIGAVPHETITHQRLILLFVKTREISQTRLKFVAFDLDRNNWIRAKAEDLDLPPAAGDDFTAVAVQKRHGSMGETLVGEPSGDSLTNESLPTILAIRTSSGRIYVRTLHNSATDWSGSWIPLLGNLKTELYSGLCALVQRSRDEYLMVVEGNDGWLFYRIFSIEPVISRDDGFWRAIAQAKFKGAFVLPGSPDVAVCYHKAGSVRCKIVVETAALIPNGLPNSSIEFLTTWLISVVGVTLEDYTFDITVDYVLDHWPKQQTEGANCSFFDIDYGVRYIGNLLHLLTLTEPAWDLTLPELNLAEESCLTKTRAEYRQEILDKLQALALDTFAQTMQRAASASFHDAELGRWKLADWYVRQFGESVNAGEEVSLVSAVTNAFAQSDETSFRLRGVELGDQHSIFQFKGAHVVPSGGDEDAGPTPRKIVVYRKSNGSFRQKLRRSGDSLSPATQRIRLTPGGDGPFDLTPLTAKEDLQARRVEIREMYEGMSAQSSMRLYLKEAYNLVPAYLGYELQRNRHYEAALLWYRQVYDYLQPKIKRKIDHGLKLEAQLGVSYEDVEEWLGDASNAHAIAATRKNTYTRHILLMIVRCLIEYADALFSRDNVTDNTRARELYVLALRLIEDLGALKPGSSSCADIIGQLEIDVAEGDVPVEQFRSGLKQIQDPDRLSSLVNNLRTISHDTARPTIERLGAMREAMIAALEETPAAPSLSEVLDSKHEIVAALENQFVADASKRALLTKTQTGGRQHALAVLAHVAEQSEATLLQPATQLSWLQTPRAEEEETPVAQTLDLASFDPASSRRLSVLSKVKQASPLAGMAMMGLGSFAIDTGVSFEFCIPQNPVIQALRTRASNNLNKLRTCRNIAGFVRQLDPYGAPIGVGAGLVSPDGTIFSGVVDAPPTIYRFSALISRAKELAGIAQQIEAGYQAALESAEREALTLLQAEQNVELASARVTLQDLRVTQANSELGLAQIQKGSAVLRENTLSDWIDAGVSGHETASLEAYREAGEAQRSAAIASAIGQAANAAMSGLQGGEGWLGKITTPARIALSSVATTAAIAEGVYNVQAIEAGTSAQTHSTLASFERREQQWRLEQGLAALDIQISDQQIELAKNQIDIVEQERAIAALEQTHAADVLNFLLSKDFTEEMYRWIASVLQEVYRFFLAEATAIARVAEQQLAFERQQGSLKVIQSDYWDITDMTVAGAGADRLGLTASARLLKDIFALDNYAFDTRQRKQSLTLTFDLAAMFPLEFQRFRETGVLSFEIKQEFVDRQMPGYYLCLIQQVSVSVVALIPPTVGIRATLTSSGVSRVVVGGGDTFQSVVIRNLPERLALTSATTVSSEIELEPETQSLLKPFEGSGVDSLWELRMPKATNQFDYGSMASVLFTVNMTALHSFAYEREVIERLDRRVSFERAFDFRQVFADAWYDLNNPDQTSTPMVVRFETRRSDFPANLVGLAIQNVVLYVVRRDGEVFEQAIRHLHFTGPGMSGPSGGAATTVDGRVSTRSGNGVNWLSLIGQEPHGTWELAFPDDAPSLTDARDRIASGSIEDLLLVLTVSGDTPPIPA